MKQIDDARRLRIWHEQLGFHHVRFLNIVADDLGTLADEQDHTVALPSQQRGRKP